MLIENLPVDVDAVLDSVIGKQTIKKGKNVIMRIGDAEVEYDSRFRLYLQTKLSNPHYKPEIAAQVCGAWLPCDLIPDVSVTHSVRSFLC